MDRESIQDLKKLFNRAEQYAKEVEMLRSEVQIPAINELRYAGHHLLKAIDEEGYVSDDLLEAKSHCFRAMYEAVEAGIVFCLDEIKEFQERYSDVVVSEVIADYPDRLARVQRAMTLIVDGRTGRTSVEAQVECYADELRVVREIMEVFKASRDDLNVKRAQAEEARRNADAVRRRDHTRIAVIILAAVLAFLAAVFFP